MVYPRKWAVATAAGDHLKDLDWDPMVDAANGMNIAGGVTIQYPYSFIVRNVGGVYDAISGNGVLTYGGSSDAGGVDGADASAVTQACLDAATTGGILHFGRGTFNLHGLTAKNFVTIEGEYMKTQGESGGGTLFALDDNADMFTIAGTGLYSGYARNIIFRNLQLYGGNRAYHFLNALNTHSVTIRDCAINSFAGGAIRAEACWEWTIDNNFFSYNGTKIDPSNTACIYLKNGETAAGQCNGFRILNNTIGTENSAAIYSDITGASAYKYNAVLFGPNNVVHGEPLAADRCSCFYIEGDFNSSQFRDNAFIYSSLGFIKIGLNSTDIVIRGNSFLNAGLLATPAYMIEFDGANFLTYARINGNYFAYHLSGGTGDVPSDGVIDATGAYLIDAENNQLECFGENPPFLKGCAGSTNKGFTNRRGSDGLIFRTPKTYVSTISVTGASNTFTVPYDLDGRAATNIQITQRSGAYAGEFCWYTPTTTGFTLYVTNQPGASDWFFDILATYDNGYAIN
jgi:hypothetical protein